MRASAMLSAIGLAALGLTACHFGSQAPAETAPGASPETLAPETTYHPLTPDQTRAPDAPSHLNLSVETIARGLSFPWSLAFLPDGRVLVTERDGRLRVVTREGQVSDPVQGLPRVFAQGQGGLLDVSVGPSFTSDHLIYWSYSEPRAGGGNGTSVARGRLSDDARRVDNVQVIFRQAPDWHNDLHFGGRLVWAPDGHLFITLGEHFDPESRVMAQTLDNDFGKVVRINADGTIPSDNPFVHTPGARPEIWSYGHRNVQGAAIQPSTGLLWTNEHGPRGGDELNLDAAGKNYGWPVITYGIDYSGEKEGEGIQVHEGMEQPVYYWDPVIAGSGSTFYQGDLFPWKGDYLIAGLRGMLVRVHLENQRVVGEERLLTDQGRLRDVVEAPDGALWFVTDDPEGVVLRVTPAG